MRTQRTSRLNPHPDTPQIMSRQVLEKLCRDGKVIETKGLRPAVIEHMHNDGRERITKLWYPKSGFSTDRFRPYAWRFVAATEELHRRNFRSPQVVGFGVLDHEPAIKWVTYEKLAGKPLREISQQQPQELAIAELAGFVHTLHDAGIYFRALNLGNVLICDDNGYGLIDVADMKFRSTLPLRLRIRNLGSFCAHPGDSAYMDGGAADAIVTAYCEVARFEAGQILPKVHGDVQRRRDKMTRIRSRRGLAPLKTGEYPTDEERHA